MEIKYFKYSVIALCKNGAMYYLGSDAIPAVDEEYVADIMSTSYFSDTSSRHFRVFCGSMSAAEYYRYLESRRVCDYRPAMRKDSNDRFIPNRHQRKHGATSVPAEKRVWGKGALR